MMRATGHFGHSLINEVGGDQCRGQAMVCGAVPQLAVAVVSPGIDLSFYTGWKEKKSSDL